jgi:hypothetical protein
MPTLLRLQLQKDSFIKILPVSHASTIGNTIRWWACYLTSRTRLARRILWQPIKQLVSLINLCLSMKNNVIRIGRYLLDTRKCSIIYNPAITKGLKCLSMQTLLAVGPKPMLTMLRTFSPRRGRSSCTQNS